MKRVLHKRPLSWVNGRRGAFQLLFGLVYGCLGMTAAASPKWNGALEWLAPFAAPWCLGLLWAAAASLALIGAFLPRPKDALSFAALAGAPIFTGFLFVIGAMVGPVPAAAGYGIIVYWGLGAAVMVVSGMTGDSDRDEREVKIWTRG